MAVIRGNAASVEFRGVSKVYPRARTAAVDDISLFIEAGRLVTLLGPSGCGKTTTLRMIAGLEMATGGQILIGGDDVTRLPATDRDVSMVFQSYALFPHMTVRENVEYGLRFSGHARKEVAERANIPLEDVLVLREAARVAASLDEPVGDGDTTLGDLRAAEAVELEDEVTDRQRWRWDAVSSGSHQSRTSATSWIIGPDSRYWSPATGGAWPSAIAASASTTWASTVSMARSA